MADVDVRVKDRIAVVTLNRPQQRNAMTLAMWQAVARIFNDLGQNNDCRAIVLTGAGGNFSVGADVAEFGQVRSNKTQSKAYEVAVDASSDAIAGVGKPVLAVLEGYCLGGGCHLAMACDFRYAHSNASIGIPAAKLSIVYGVRSTQRLLALVGIGHAKRMLFSGQRYSAPNAPQGFIDDISPDPMSSAMSFARELAQLAPLSISGAKTILNGLSMGEGALNLEAADALIDFTSDSNDYEEGRKAFAEKRSPDFRGT
ncbi:MAG: enoyl-CoA hydratase/isomerase family protein [Rhizobiales bacterium]|nr:enoyl-CoA hydratase/isomerase family protein [Hyphomicrobiales bacterium]